MTSTAVHDVFGASRWISGLLGRFGLSPEPGRTSLWSILLVVTIISIPPLLLSALSGTAWGGAVEIPFLHDVNAVVRLFVVVPVLVIATRAVGVQLAVAMDYLDSSSLIREADREEYGDARADITRRASSTAIELLILALTLIVPWLILFLFVSEPGAGMTNWKLHVPDGSTLTPAGWYFTLISRPLVGFFLILWAWRYMVWCLFLRRMGGLDLVLQPAHPDLVGGLAPIVRAHASFALVGFALNSALSGAIANELLYGGFTVADARPEILFFTVISLVALALPLVVFTPGLLRAKNRGILEYGRLAHDLTVDFDGRWQNERQERLLDTADPSAMADFNADYDTVRSARAFPLGLRQLAMLGVLLFIPFGALSLTQVSLLELVKSMASKAF